MTFLNSVSLRAKLAVLIGLSIVAMLVTSAVVLQSKRHSLLAERQHAVQAVVEAVAASVAQIQSQVAAGTLPEKEGRERGLALVKAARFNGKDYVWVQDAEHMVMHPIKPELDGTPLASIKDPDGVAFFAEIGKQVAANGSGVQAYRWPKPGSDVPVGKISYGKGLPAWGWILGSGVYLDDVEAAFWSDVRNTVPWLVLTSGLLLVTGIVITRKITHTVAAAADFADGIARGDLSRDMKPDGHDELGQLVSALRTMCVRLRERHEADHALALRNQRILSALDCARTNIRIVDNEGVIQYVNEALRGTMREITPKLREKIPDFSVDTVIGRSIGMFYADPAAALQRLRAITGTVTSRMEIGGRTFDVVTNPIVDSQGERIGTIGEWVDRTAQLRTEHELKALITGASRGDFTVRLDRAGKEGFYLELADALNQLMGNSADALDKVDAVLAGVASGDLTGQMDGEFEGTLGQLQGDLNATVVRLREMVGQIHHSAQVIHVAAREIASGNNDLALRTERQSSGIEQMASVIEEISTTTRLNADNARRANDLAHASAKTTEQGGRLMEEVVRSMAAIQDSSKRIGEIVGVIDSIAFQTNILALNAAVEAARAGEEGRGFSVVAAEVRSLAQRSAEAAREIKILISSSGTHVDQGVKLVDETGSTIRQVVESFRAVTGFVSDIASASAEQSVGVEKVASAVTEMDDTTQKNAALVEEATAAAQSLEEQASALVDSVSLFSLN